MKIALGCQARVGKDMVGEWLATMGYQRLSFAGPVYDAMYAVQDSLGIERCKDRSLLIAIGEWGREQYEEFWVDKLIDRIDGDHVVVTDVRYPNEFDALKQAGFIMVQITRDEAIPVDHDNERYLLSYDWDFVLSNDGTKEELYEKMEFIIS